MSEESNQKQEFLLDGIDYSDVVETKVSQGDLVNLLIEREITKYKVQMEKLGEKLNPLEEEMEKLSISFIKKARGQFKESENAKIAELKKTFGKKLVVEKEFSFVGQAWYQNPVWSEDNPLMISNWNARYSGQLYKASRTIITCKMDLQNAEDKERRSYVSVSIIDWSKLYFRMDYKCSITENRSKKESTNLNYKFGNKLKANEKTLKPIHDKILELLEKKAELINKLNWMEAKIKQITNNRSTVQAQITKNILESSALGTQLLDKITTDRNLLGPGENINLPGDDENSRSHY